MTRWYRVTFSLSDGRRWRVIEPANTRRTAEQMARDRFWIEVTARDLDSPRIRGVHEIEYLLTGAPHPKTPCKGTFL